VRSTTKWLKSDPEVQIIEVLLDNLSPLNATEEEWVTSPIEVSIDSDLIETTSPARLVRLRSNDQALLKVGVKNVDGVEPGTAGTVSVTIEGFEGSLARSGGWEIIAGVPDWESNDSSLATHEAPEWV
jgi:alpha-L-fucosidase